VERGPPIVTFLKRVLTRLKSAAVVSRPYSERVILCLAGNPSIDKLFEVDRLAPGEIHRPEHFVQLPGGKGIHVAQVSAALGAPTVVTGLLAGHTGRWIAQTLAAQGVPGRFAWGRGETRSSLSVADREGGGLTEFYEDGTVIEATEWQAVKEIVLELLPQASWLALAGSMPPGAPVDGYAELISAAREAGVPAAVDTRADALTRVVDAAPALVKINVHEAAELLGHPIEGDADVREALEEIRARAGGEGHAAAITLGEDGALLIEPAGTAWRGRCRVRGRYPVGGGDTFLGGLLVGLTRGSAWSEALRLALGAAAANAEMPGAAHFDAHRALELAGQAEVGSVS
jgi:1-phosphofructokinase family hexose kinase